MTTLKTRISGYRDFAVKTGGMATVHLCKSETGQGFVAIKRLKAELAADQELVIRFLRECNIWMRLGSHLNIVEAYYAQAAPPESPFVILEYVEGTLRDQMRGVPWEPQRCLRTIAGVCSGLIHVRSIIPGFVHRDLKPENIMLTSNKVAKVTDFGLATLKQVSKGRLTVPDVVPVESPTPSEAFITSVNSVMGTPQYMAPEQIRGDPLDATTDIYAIGCVLFELLTGRPVVGLHADAAQSMSWHLTEAQPDPRTFADGIPASVVTITNRCLAKEPDCRFQSMNEMRDRIGDVLLSEFGCRLFPVPAGKWEEERLVSSCQSLVSLGFFDDAMSTAQQVISQSTNNMWVALATLAQVRVHLGRGESEQAKNKLTEIEPVVCKVAKHEVYGIYHNESCLLANVKGDKEACLEHAKLTVKYLPDASFAWSNLGDAYMGLSMKKEGMDAYLHAIRISADVRYYIRLHQLLFTGDSGPNRPPIPIQIGHSFRSKSATCSDSNRPGIPDQIGRPYDG